MYLYDLLSASLLTQRTLPRILSLQEKNPPHFHLSCYGSILEELLDLDSCGFFFQLEIMGGKLFRHDGSMVLHFVWSFMSRIKQHILVSLLSSNFLKEINGFKPGLWVHSDHIWTTSRKNNLVVVNEDFK